MPKFNNEALKSNIENKFSENRQDFNWSSQFGADILQVPKGQVRDVARFLKEQEKFDFLMNVTGVDYPGKAERFEGRL